MVDAKETTYVKLALVPLELRDLNALVSNMHRHHKPVQGHRFSVGCVNVHTDVLIGGASVGRPVSRGYNPRTTLEVTRLVTDGTRNACSFLYSACARIGRAMGYKNIQTYILDDESGISLVASGWSINGVIRGRQWQRNDGIINRTDQPTCNKQRWSKILNTNITVMEE